MHKKHKPPGLRQIGCFFITQGCDGRGNSTICHKLRITLAAGVRLLERPRIKPTNTMIKEIIIDENYQTVRLFDAIKKGDIYKVPYEKSRHNGIRMEATRRNRDLRLTGVLKNRMDVKFRVSAKEYPGWTSIICIK